MVQKLLNYTVLERLGDGAKSAIYAVQDPASGRKYAMKHVVRVNQKDIRFIEQMETEFSISKNFNHPNLRKSIYLKISKTLLLKVSEAFMTMELVDGKPLEVSLPGCTLVEIIDVFIQAAKGLKHMHDLGFAHCDIKPNNILRAENGHVTVIDFGQSCLLGTVKERIQGTPDFIAPEQVNRKPISVQTDVFNLGATLYWALTGRNIPTLYTIQKQKGGNNLLSDELFQTPKDLNPMVPAAIDKMVMDCVSTRRDKRPADMEAMIQKLEIGQHILERERSERPRNTPATADDSVA